MRYLRLLPILLAGLLLPDCTDNVAGAGSETTNGIIGSVRNTDDTPVPDAVVRLFPDDYNPVADAGRGLVFTDTTDSDGRFAFRDIGNGNFTIVARSSTLEMNAMKRGIAVADSDSVVVVDPAVLLRPGAIVADFSGTVRTAEGYVFIPGTDLYTGIDSSDIAVLGEVPSGDVTTLMYASPAGERNLLHETVVVEPDGSVTIGYCAWTGTREIVLNTSAGGAGISENLYGFPVLIRLNDANFDFSEAEASGGDLLVTGRDQTLLSFEIERWDRENRRAEIWVRIDTLFGNDSVQSIRLYWGNADTETAVTAGAVFDTAGGFRGVWHMGDAGDTVHDATENRSSAVAPEQSRPSVAEGYIGRGRTFDGNEKYLTVPGSASGPLNFPENGTYTVSAWVMADIFDGLSHVIVCKGNLQYFLWLTPIHLNATQWEFAEFRSGKGWDLACRPAQPGQWVLLTGVRDGAVQRLYVNGIQADTLINFAFSEQHDSTSDFFIGRYAQKMASPNNDEGYCYFKGGIDEVRICGAARSAAWIRLCYRNQGADDRLVVFK